MEQPNVARKRYFLTVSGPVWCFGEQFGVKGDKHKVAMVFGIEQVREFIDRQRYFAEKGKSLCAHKQPRGLVSDLSLRAGYRT